MANNVEIQYQKWNKLEFNVNNFKQNAGVNYMTEHINNIVNHLEISSISSSLIF